MLRLKGLWGVERLLECMDGWQRQRQECQSERTEDCDSVSQCDSVTGSGLFFGDYRSSRHSSAMLAPSSTSALSGIDGAANVQCQTSSGYFVTTTQDCLCRKYRGGALDSLISRQYPENLIDQTYQTMTASHNRSIFPK